MKRQLTASMFLVCLWIASVYAQPETITRPSSPEASPSTKETSEKTEEEITREIIESFGQPVVWGQRVLPGFAIQVDLPRKPIRQTYYSYEEALGNAEMILYMSSSDRSTFVVGRSRLPFSITDEQLLRDVYSEMLAGLSEDSVDAFKHVRDFVFQGKLGVEMKSIPQDPRYLGGAARAFMAGRDVYILLAMPLADPEVDDPPEKSESQSTMEEFERFFGSIEPVEQVSQEKTKQPQLEGEWVGGVYRSTYFGFALTLPNDWYRLSEDDVQGIQKWGREVVAANSEGKLGSTPKRETNLASFASAPLGSEMVSMLSLNRGPQAKSFEDVVKVSRLTEATVEKISNYEIVKKSHETTLGKTRAMSLVNRVKIAGEIQNQHVFFFHAKGHLLAATLTCYSEKDCSDGLSALSTLNFESNRDQ